MSESAELVLITGMSGAGRSTVAHSMEDLGWYVVDNLPPALLVPLYELASRTVASIAVVVDVRGRQFFDDLNQALAALGEKGISRRIVFLDAADEVLVRRFESTRRPHPLQGSGLILDGITKERERLRDARSAADVIIDSTSLNIHQLDRKVAEIFAAPSQSDLRVNILSFGYKYGIPVDADLVMDCRFIPNPHWNPELRPLTGLDAPVRDDVLGHQNVQEFLDRYQSLFTTMAAGFINEGRRYLTLAVGCTGGKHRSVAIAEELHRRFDSLAIVDSEIATQTIHRDLGRE